MARSSGTDGNVLAALDAGRGEVFVAGVYASGTRATIRDQQLLTSAEFIALSSTWQIVTPDAKIAELAREHGLRVEEIDRPGADVIARLGFEKIRSGDVVSVESLDANYIRRSDAEVKKIGETRK